MKFECTGRVRVLSGTTASTGSDGRRFFTRFRSLAALSLATSLAPFLTSTPGLETTRDGKFVAQARAGSSLPAIPGAHTVVASAPGNLASNRSDVCDLEGGLEPRCA